MVHFITVTRAAKHVILTTLIAAMLTLNGIACSHQAAEATQDKGSDEVEKKDLEPSQASKEKSDQNGIDAATIAAYEKLGATYRVEGLPYFKFTKFPKVNLPDVAVPFGIDLTNSDGCNCRSYSHKSRFSQGRAALFRAIMDINGFWGS